MEGHAAHGVRQPGAKREQTTLDAKGQAEFAAWAQQWLSYIARTVSVPRQYVAVVHAMDGDWQQVQQDFQRVLATLARLNRLTQAQGRDIPDIGLFKYNVVAFLGVHFVP